MSRKLTAELFGLVNAYHEIDESTIDKMKDLLAKGAQSIYNPCNSCDKPIPLLWYALNSLNLPIIRFIHETFGIDKSHTHVAVAAMEFNTIPDFLQYEKQRGIWTDFRYTRSYYSELRRLRSEILNDYTFEYDLYVFYLREKTHVDTSLSAEEFALHKQTHDKYNLRRFEGKQAYYYGIWKEIIDLLGFTEEEILSKQNEDFMKGNDRVHRYISITYY